MPLIFSCQKALQRTNLEVGALSLMFNGTPINSNPVIYVLVKLVWQVFKCHDPNVIQHSMSQWLSSKHVMNDHLVLYGALLLGFKCPLLPP